MEICLPSGCLLNLQLCSKRTDKGTVGFAYVIKCRSLTRMLLFCIEKCFCFVCFIFCAVWTLWIVKAWQTNSLNVLFLMLLVFSFVLWPWTNDSWDATFEHANGHTCESTSFLVANVSMDGNKRKLSSVLFHSSEKYRWGPDASVIRWCVWSGNWHLCHSPPNFSSFLFYSSENGQYKKKR